LAAFAFSINYLFYAVCLIYITAAIFSVFIKPTLQSRLPLKIEMKSNWQTGFQFIKNSSPLTYLVKVGFLWRLFLGLQASLLVIYIKTYLDGNDIQYGYFMTLLSLGSILGSLIGPWIGKRFSEKKIILYGLCLHYGTFAALGVINQIAAAYLLIFLSFLIFYATLVSMHTLRDISTMSSIRGRVYGSVTAIITPPAVVSMLAGGYLAELVGVQWILLIAGILAVISLVGISLGTPLQVEEIQSAKSSAA
jgi:MFS family permease